MNRFFLVLAVMLTVTSCGITRQVDYTAYDADSLPERVQFNMNHTKEELANLDCYKKLYFPEEIQSGDPPMDVLLDSMICSHIRSFAPSKMNPDLDWNWYVRSHKHIAYYYRYQGIIYARPDFELNDMAVERMDTINFDPHCGWQPGMNMNASVDGMLNYYRTIAQYDRMIVVFEDDECMREMIRDEYSAWHRLNCAMYLLLCGYTAANASYSYAPVDLNRTFEDWAIQRTEELLLEKEVFGGNNVRCRRVGRKENCDFGRLKKFYIENSDPFFIATIEQCLSNWTSSRERIALKLNGRKQKQYRRISENAYQRIFQELEFLTKIWY